VVVWLQFRPSVSWIQVHVCNTLLTPTLHHIFITYIPVASMGHCPPQPFSLFSPAFSPSPSFWLAQAILSQTFYCTNIPTVLTPVLLHTYTPVTMEQTQCSETLAFNLQIPANHPEESIRHSEYGESLKSRSVYQSYQTGLISFILYCRWLYKNAAVTTVTTDPKDSQYLLMKVVISEAQLSIFRHNFIKSWWWVCAWRNSYFCI
jgi:hypothetical protein